MKRLICLFCIFLLMFGLSVPAFASTNEILPPVNVDGIDYDSYFILENSRSYVCFLYDSNYWTPMVRDVPHTGSSGTYYTLFLVHPSDSDAPAPYLDSVFKENFDSSIGDNGWGEFVPEMNTGTYSDGTHYYFADINVISILSSNKNINFGYLDKYTKQVVETGVFFSLPSLEGVTTEALSQLQNQTTQNQMIVALCGVCCLALLISLVLLRKVLFRFLNN